MKQFIRKVFKLRSDRGINFYVIDFLFRRVLRQNSKVKWAIHHTSTIHVPSKLTVGLGTFPGVSPNVYIAANNGIEIGDFTSIGPSVSLISANYDTYNKGIVQEGLPMKIGNHCWLGSHIVVMPEIVLGDFTMVGAGSIVTKSFPDGYCVISGNPARVIQFLDKESCAAIAESKRK